jgi:phosphohistidine phosphatase
MDLYILRHAIAAERNTKGRDTDFERALTQEGEEKLRRVARAMRNLELSFDLILSSPYVRARQTAELVATALALRKRLELHEGLACDANPREFLVELAKRSPAPESLLIVGHEPFLSTLASLLISGTAKSCLTLKKAGLCRLSLDSLRVGRCATLEWLLTPRQMLLMA